MKIQRLENAELSVSHFSQSLIQNSIDGIIGFDSKCLYTIWNPAMEKISGKKKEEVLGVLSWKTFPFLMKNGEKERMVRTLKGESFRIEGLEYNVPETDSKGYYDAQYFPLTDKEGKIIGGMKVIHETTKRKKVEAALKLKNEQLLEAQEIAVMGDWIFDVHTNESNWSDEVYKLFGARRIPGQSTFDILEEYVLPEDFQKIRELAEKAITLGVPYHSQYRIKRFDGSIRMIATRAKPEYDEKGNVVKLKGVCQDITERWAAMEKIKELNNILELKVEERTFELIKKNEELLRINSDLDNFIYTASHDLKAPISNIEGLMQSLTDELKVYSNTELEVMIDLIHNSIQRFKDTIKELMEITKIQKDIQENEIEIIRFSSIMDDVQFSLERLMKDCCPEMEINFSVETIKFSRKYLRSILYNLISNGMKYRSPDRMCSLKIKTELKDGHVVLSVSDNGLGMKENQKMKIFSMFKRLHDHVEGTGVGLYIVKRIIENAGGRIEVDTMEGVGSEFRVYFKNEN